MKLLLALALLASLALEEGCSGARLPADLTAEALLDCQVRALLPLMQDLEHASLESVQAAVERMKSCAAIYDAGPAH